MKILKTYRNVLALWFFHEKSAEKSVANTCLSLVKLNWPWIPFSVAILATINFLYFEVETPQEYLECFYILITTLTNVVLFIMLVWKKEHRFEIIEELEILIEKRKFNSNLYINIVGFKYSNRFPQISGSKNPTSLQIYEKASTFVEKWSRVMYFAYLSVIAFIATVPYLITSYFLYFTTDREKDVFHMPFRPWISFFAFSIDFRTPIGYFINMCEQSLVAVSIVLITGSEMLFQFGLCWILKSLAKDVHLELDTFSWLHKLETYKEIQQHKNPNHQQYKHKPETNNKAELYTKMCRLIHFHYISKQ